MWQWCVAGAAIGAGAQLFGAETHGSKCDEFISIIARTLQAPESGLESELFWRGDLCFQV